MKNLYSSILIVIVALFLFAPLAVGADGHPAWDKQIAGAGRFKVLSQFNGAAVFDKETGLVWEQSPSTTSRTWLSAQFDCNDKVVGNRKGWRLPTVQELASLVVPSENEPALPDDHPFLNVQSPRYWFATTDASNAGKVWVVDLDTGEMGGISVRATSTLSGVSVVDRGWMLSDLVI